MLVPVPPEMSPTLAVVSLSMRPTSMWSMASAAIFTALTPFSGSKPACAERPLMSAVT